MGWKAAYKAHQATHDKDSLLLALTVKYNCQIARHGSGFYWPDRQN